MFFFVNKFWNHVLNTCLSVHVTQVSSFRLVPLPEHRTSILPLFLVRRPGHLYTGTIKMLCSYWCPCLSTVPGYSVWTHYNKLYKRNQTNFAYWTIPDKTVKSNFVNNNPILRSSFAPLLFKPLRGPFCCMIQVDYKILVDYMIISWEHNGHKTLKIDDKFR